MQDTALYQYLLGLKSPWTVSRVKLDVNGQRVDVWAEHPDDVAWGVMQRALTRGRSRKQARIVRRIGVDEKAAAKGQRYLTLVCDLDEGTVEPIAEDRTQESLASYYAGLTQVQRNGIEASRIV